MNQYKSHCLNSMASLHLPDNIKVHFASLESINKITACSEMGVNYGLYSAFQYVFKRVFRNKTLSDSDKFLLKTLNEKFNHVIQDSGLFSLLYGAKKHLADKNTVYKWYDALVEFTLEANNSATIVEIDCQDICGVDLAWEFRKRLRDDLPNRRIMNVFHLSDGIYGLDKLIEFSDYIGVGSGDPSNSSSTMYEVSSYIKKKKPTCDIHLLGCTKPETIKKCRFCTSCDSISWLSPNRFGRIGDYHINDLDTNKIKKFVGNETYSKIRSVANEVSANAYVASIEMHKRWYQIYGGDQDYTKNF